MTTRDAPDPGLVVAGALGCASVELGLVPLASLPPAGGFKVPLLLPLPPVLTPVRGWFGFVPGFAGEVPFSRIRKPSDWPSFSACQRWH